MFSELPKLFDRNFTAGYLLPAVFFLVSSTLLLIIFGLADFLSWLIDPANALIGTAIIVVVAWFSSILLIALNWHIYRLMEGYAFGEYNPFHLLSRIRGKPQKKRFGEIQEEILKLRREREQNNGLDATKTERLRGLVLEYAENFPDSEDFILPTKFGNTIRAFEVYPRVMYGIEGIQGWNRLQAVVPSEYLKLVDNAKTETDIWMNLWLLSLALVVEYLALGVIIGQFPVFWIIIPIALIIAWLSSKWASDAAAAWGEQVKSAFDIYLPRLREEIGNKEHYTREEEFEFWTKFSQAITYRSPKQLDELHSIKASSEKKQAQLPNTSILGEGIDEIPLPSNEISQERKMGKQ